MFDVWFGVVRFGRVRFGRVSEAGAWGDMMGCVECDEVQKQAFDKNIPTSVPIAYMRIDAANIAVIGCPKHVKMAIDRMRRGFKHE